jgi:hypothetical protein
MARTHNIRLDRRAFEDFVNNSDESRRFFNKLGRDIRDEARTGARVISSKVDAIVSQVENDADGIYLDVGYKRHHPGFFLWFYEVGTVRDAPRPHLRPALRPRL